MVHDPRYRHDVEQPATQEYEVEANGTTTTLRLNERDAAARGLLKGTEAVVDVTAGASPDPDRPSVSDDDPNLPNVGTTQTTDPYASVGGAAAVGDGAGEVGTIAPADQVGPDGGVGDPATGTGEKAVTAANKGRRAATK